MMVDTGHIASDKEKEHHLYEHSSTISHISHSNDQLDLVILANDERSAVMYRFWWSRTGEFCQPVELCWRVSYAD